MDAIRWCLGEQSARDLRGQRAEDVIHAGRRRVLGSAEVSLGFDDNGAVDRELWVSRRLLRSGESEYVVNGGRRRLRDVQHALSRLGMDHPRFVVVTQGMTDFLLSATAAERRALLEQAAGLASYRQRRDEAAQKLVSSEQNILTAEAVLIELEPRLRILQRQARAIEARDDLVRRLHARQALWYTVRQAELGRELQLATSELDVADEKRRVTRAKLDEIERAAEQVITREREWQRRVDEASAGLYAAQREMDTVSHAVEMLKRNLAELERARRVLIQRLGELDTETAAAITRHARMMKDIQAATAAEADSQEAERQARERVRQLQAELAQHEGVLRDMKDGVRCRRAERDRLSDEVRGLSGALEDLAAHIQRLRVAAGSAEDRRRDVRAEEVSARADVQDAEAKLDSARERAEECSHSLAAAEEKLHRLQRLQSDIREDFRDLTARQASVSRIFASLEREMSGTALGSLEVAGGAETAVDAALYGWRTGYAAAGSVPVDFFQWRQTIASHFSPSTCWGDAVAAGPDMPAVLLATIVVPDEAEAQRLWGLIAPLAAHRVGSPSIQVVTRDGALVAAQGRRAHSADDRGTRFLTARADLAGLERALARCRRNEARLSSLARHMDPHHERLAAENSSAKLEMKSAEKLLVRAETALHELEARRERLDREAQEYTTGISLGTEKSEALSIQVAEARDLLASASRRLDEQDHAASAAEDEAAQTRASLESARRTAAESSGDSAVLARRLQALMDVARANEAEVTRLQREPARLQQELEATDTDSRESHRELERMEQSRATLAAGVVERERELTAVRSNGPRAKDTAAALRTAREASDRAIARFERANARKDEIEAARLRLEDEIEREMGSLDVPAVDEDDEELPTEDEIRRLRARAAAYAEYDPSAVHEYRELAERRDYLTSQISDLKATADGLREIMRIADSEMQTRFSAALDRVSEEFDRVLRVMLRGGEARLEQAAEGGIDVRVSLPGKRARSSASFSGGERALVAISLLFGVLRIRPAPFCVLDEVDAALDETNVDRYLEALRDLSERMQTIVVTHNRATMAAATALYGLTIDAEGASNVLSLRLDQYDAAVS